MVSQNVHFVDWSGTGSAKFVDQHFVQVQMHLLIQKQEKGFGRKGSLNQVRNLLCLLKCQKSLRIGGFHKLGTIRSRHLTEKVKCMFHNCTVT